MRRMTYLRPWRRAPAIVARLRAERAPVRVGDATLRWTVGAGVLALATVVVSLAIGLVTAA